MNLGPKLRTVNIRVRSDRFSRKFDTPDVCSLRSTSELCEAFRQHFQGQFTMGLFSLIETFYSYIADFPRVSLTESDGCKYEVKEGEISEALKCFGKSKSPGIYGLPYELFSSHFQMFVFILTVVFDKWFRHGSIPIQFSRVWLRGCKKTRMVGGISTATGPQLCS